MQLAAAGIVMTNSGFAELLDVSGLDVVEVGIGRRQRKSNGWLVVLQRSVISMAHGRTMRSVADQLPAMECPQHKLVALVGTTKTDGSASFYDVIIRVSDSVRAPHYPMPLPVIARSVEERELLTSLASVKSSFDLVERTDVCFVGVGAVGESRCSGAGRHHHASGSGGFAPAWRGRGDYRLGVRSGGKGARGRDEPAGRFGAVADVPTTDS